MAREAIETYVRDGTVIRPPLPAGGEPRRAGTFVSLHLPDGSLRGCIGTTEAQLGSVEEEVVANAISAATGDPRFYPVTPQELASPGYLGGCARARRRGERALARWTPSGTA